MDKIVYLFLSWACKTAHNLLFRKYLCNPYF